MLRTVSLGSAHVSVSPGRLYTSEALLGASVRNSWALEGANGGGGYMIAMVLLCYNNCRI